MKKALLFMLLIIAVILGVFLLSNNLLKKSLQGTLYVSDGDRWCWYDWEKEKMQEITWIGSDAILKICDAGDGKVWVLSYVDESKYILLLQNPEKVIYETELSFKPVDMCAYNEGVLLIREKNTDDFFQYKGQKLALRAGAGEIVYLAADGSEPQTLAECGFNTYPTETFLISQENCFTFLPRDFEVIEMNRVVCKTENICIYENGSICSQSVSGDTIRALCAGGHIFVAVGTNRIYRFSPISGITTKGIKCNGVSKGTVSPNGKYYVFSRFHGLLVIQWMHIF